MQAQNTYLDYLIDPRFQGVNKLFVLSFENNNHWASYLRYFLVTVEIKDYNAMVDGQIFFDLPVKMIKKHVIPFLKLWPVKETITQPVVY